MFEVGKRYAIDGSDWFQFEIVKRQGNSITYVKILHTEQYNEKRSEQKRAKIKQWPKGEIFFTNRDELITSYWKLKGAEKLLFFYALLHITIILLSY